MKTEKNLNYQNSKLISHHASNTQKNDYKEISYININEETIKHCKALVKSKIETLEGDITVEHC